MPFWPASGSLEAFDFVGVVGANNNNKPSSNLSTLSHRLINKQLRLVYRIGHAAM